MTPYGDGVLQFYFVGEPVREDELYLGYEQWSPSPRKVQKRLPSPPKVQKPRSVLNAASLAYIGDCIYEVCLCFKLDICITIGNCTQPILRRAHIIVTCVSKIELAWT